MNDNDNIKSEEDMLEHSNSADQDSEAPLSHQKENNSKQIDNALRRLRTLFHYHQIDADEGKECGDLISTDDKTPSEDSLDEDYQGSLEESLNVHKYEAKNLHRNIIDRSITFMLEKIDEIFKRTF